VAQQGQTPPSQFGASVAAQSESMRPDGMPTQRSDVVRFFTDAEWYFSWGYNIEYWAPTDIHVSSAGQNFTLHGVQGVDEPGGEEGIFTGDLFGPQYNFRVGRFINDRWGIEFSFDHTKFTTVDGQTVNATGSIKGPITLNGSNFYEVLHNGANHVMINGVYRYPLLGQTNHLHSGIHV